MQKLISVIIPVYNHAYTLHECLDVLGCQTYDNYEVIVVNDGSSDDFELTINNTLKSLRGRHKFVDKVKIINQTNQGAASARNRGFKEAKGEYVIFYDADTMANPDMFSKMAAALEKNPDKSYAYCDFRFGHKLMRGREFDGDELKKQNYIDTTSLLRARDFSGFDESLKRFQDWDLWLTMLEKNKIGVYLTECLFTKKIVGGRIGYSSWLPSFMYKLPWKTKKVKEYEAAKQIIFKKHNLWT